MAKQRFRDTKKGKITNIKSKKSGNSATSNIKYINLMDYFKALITDSFMLWMPIVYGVIYLIFGGRVGFSNHMLQGWLILFAILTVIESLFLYFSANSQTPGMKAYNIKLIFEPTKKKPPFTTIVLRQILSKISFVSFLWLIIFFNKNHKNIQDFITSTALVYEKNNS